MTATQTGKGSFPTTDWGLLKDVRGNNTGAKRAALDILIRRYWKPVFHFLRYSGAGEESAKDSTQAFFASWLENDSFAKADRNRGRFRSYVLTSLKRFVANEHRAAYAQKRRPSAGLFSLDELMDNVDMPFEPVDGMTPEMIFDKSWASEIIQRVLRHYELECKHTDQLAHYDIFSRRIIKPILEGANEASYAELAREHELTEKQAANLLLTAKRAFQRLLKEEIRLYAESEAEVSEETRAIFRILGQ